MANLFEKLANKKLAEKSTTVTTASSEPTTETIVTAGGDSEDTSEETSPLVSPSTEVAIAAPTSFAELASKKVADVSTSKMFEAKANDILSDVELPDKPEKDASDEVVLAYYFEKLSVLTDHVTGCRQTLGEINEFMMDKSDEILSVANMQNLTAAMDKVTRSSHGKAQAKKVTQQKKSAKSEAKKVEVDEIGEELGDIF